MLLIVVLALFVLYIVVIGRDAPALGVSLPYALVGTSFLSFALFGTHVQQRHATAQLPTNAKSEWLSILFTHPKMLLALGGLSFSIAFANGLALVGLSDDALIRLSVVLGLAVAGNTYLLLWLPVITHLQSFPSRREEYANETRLPLILAVAAAAPVCFALAYTVHTNIQSPTRLELGPLSIVLLFAAMSAFLAGIYSVRGVYGTLTRSYFRNAALWLIPVLLIAAGCEYIFRGSWLLWGFSSVALTGMLLVAIRSVTAMSRTT